MPVEISLPAGFREAGAPMLGRVLQVGSKLRPNEFGLDVLTRPYVTRRDRTPFLLPKKGEADFQYSELTCSTFEVTEQAGFHDALVIEYVGNLPGTVSTIGNEYGRRLETVQIGSDERENIEIEYHAAYAIYRYVTEGEPRRPRYTGPVMFGPDEMTIVSTRPATFVGNVRRRTEYEIQDSLESFRGIPRGRYFEVTEEWVRRLVPTNSLQRKRSVLKVFGGFSDSRPIAP